MNAQVGAACRIARLVEEGGLWRADVEPCSTSADVRSERRDSRSRRSNIDRRFMFLSLAQKHRYGVQN